MSSPRDRIKKLRGHATLNGIDYVEVHGAAQTELRVHFVNPVSGLEQVITGATITGGDKIPEVPVLPIAAADWQLPSGDVLILRVAAPGDFSQYTLKLTVTPNPPSGAKALDPFFAHALFSFKAGCESTLDCEAPDPACVKDRGGLPEIDYLAKDFGSFREALLEFSALRYPAWKERSEADFGVMFLEALSSVADDLSYFQDRVAAEAYLETATERRSLVRLSRLVDYEPRPATAARVLLRVSLPDLAYVTTVTAPFPLRAQGPDGASIDFEIGDGISGDGAAYPLRGAWSAMAPYWWDDSERCLPRGATEAWIKGSGLGLQEGQTLLIETAPPVAGAPYARQLVTLSANGEEVIDPLFTDAQNNPTVVTRIVWREEDALRRDHDLTRTTYSANIVPATEGRRATESIGIGAVPSGGQAALVRTGPNGTAQYLHTLREAPLAWLAPEGDPRGKPRPEILISGAHSWSFRRSLLDAGPFDEAFTVDPVRYRPVGQRAQSGEGAMEYDGRDGDTIRFGDGTFGVLPDTTETFLIQYRVGGGARGNLAAGAMFSLDPQSALAQHGAVIDNPFPATGGRDAEPDEVIRQRAPHAFRNDLRRAPLAKDYERFARELRWVQRSNTTFRHTGSWLAAITAPDPRGTESLSADRRAELIEKLDRVRLAGRESLVRAPRYVALDVAVVLCAEPNAFSDEVRGAVLDLLSAAARADGSKGFFHPDHLTFGQALRRASIEAAVQRISGVHGVLGVFYRKRNLMNGYTYMPPVVTLAPWELIQVDSNPSRPERGSVQVFVEGGK